MPSNAPKSHWNLLDGTTVFEALTAPSVLCLKTALGVGSLSGPTRSAFGVFELG
jgi:hypothetical protein